MPSIGALIIDLVARTGTFETDLGRAARTAERRSKQIQRQFDGLGRRIGAALGAYASIQTVQAIVRISDQYTQLRGRLALVTSSTEELGQVQQALFEIAQRTRTEMSGVADLYIKLAQTGKELGASQQELLKFTEGVGNALTVSGSNAQQASGALLQLSQALAGGTVRAEEFNSIIEGAPEILRTVAANMEGMEGSIAKLRKAVLDGKVSSEDFFRAFLKGSDELSTRARSMPVTVGQAFIRMQNNINQAISGSDMSPLVDAINDLSGTIGDPTFQKNFASFISGIVKLTGASAGAVAETAGLARFIGEQIAAATHGAASDDIVRLEDELAKLNELRSMEWWDKDILNRGRVFGKDGLVEWYSDEDLDRAIAEVQRKITNYYESRALPPVIPTSDAGGGESRGPGRPRPPSEDFVKLADKLKQQIALHGQVGKAAEISYAIQSGALEGISKAEEEQLVALARRYDAIVKSADAQKKLAEEQANAKDVIESMLFALQEQVATFERGETATLRFRIEQGDLRETFKLVGEAADEYREQILQLSRQLELMEEVSKASNDAIADFGDKVAEDLQGQADAFFEKFGEAANEDSFGEQFRDGVFRSLEDGIYTAMTDGAKKGWKGFLDAGLETIDRLVAAALAKQLATGLFGGKDGKGQWGWVSSVFGGSGGSSGIVQGEHDWFDRLAGWAGGWFGGGRANGGPVTAGVMYRVNEREGEFFRPNVSGKVIPLSKMTGGSGGVRVNQTINVAGRPDSRTASQIATETARRQRVATARFR